MGVKPFEVLSLTKTMILNPENVGYQDSIDIIYDELDKTRKSFIKIGWYLKHISDNHMYKDEYDSIYEFAHDKFKFSQPTTSRYIRLCTEFSVNHNSPELDEKFKDYNISQLFEMLPMQTEQLEQVTPDMTVSQIRKIKKKSEEVLDDDNNDIPGQASIEDFPEYMPSSGSTPEKEIKTYATSHEENEEKESVSSVAVSAYGLSKTEYPEDSLITIEGCGHKYTCSSCAQDCGIRQKERYCVGAPLGNPFSCTTMNILENIREDIGEDCQFINQELAYHTEGSKEAVPCCKKCQVSDCGYRCQRAAKLAFAETDIENIVINGECRDIEEATEMHLPAEVKTPEESRPVQPAFPVLKNNEQRKAWLADYRSWGLWYTDKNIDVNYYKFDFPDGSRLVVAEYPLRREYWNGKEEKDEYFYHLLEKNKKPYGGSSTYDEKYKHFPDSETYLIEFLKKVQKEGRADG